MKWISVEERLPERGDWVVWFSWYENDGDFQYVFGKTNGVPMPWAKYWMPLPPPPGDEQ